MPGATESISSGGGLCLPKSTNKAETMSQSYQRRVYQNAHTYNINSISLNSDGVSFTSADDLRINLWDMEYSDRCFSK
jgi:serine/threonine-protein phosphatase 2A regulatory subunit B